MLHWGWERGTPYGEAQVVDQTCEIAYWFYVVARQMEKAQAGGRQKVRASSPKKFRLLPLPKSDAGKEMKIGARHWRTLRW